jgi:putative transposase
MFWQNRIVNWREIGVSTLSKEKSYGISDALWAKIKPLLPPDPPDSGIEKLQIDNRRIMEAIICALHNDFEWDKIPDCLEMQNIIHRCFQAWRQTGLFQRMWNESIITYDELRKIYWYDLLI